MAGGIGTCEECEGPTVGGECPSCLRCERDALRARLNDEMQRGDKLDAALIDLDFDLDKARARVVELEKVAKEDYLKYDSLQEHTYKLEARVAKLGAVLRELRQYWCNHYCAIGLHTGVCDDAREVLEG